MPRTKKEGRIADSELESFARKFEELSQRYKAEGKRISIPAFCPLIPNTVDGQPGEMLDPKNRLHQARAYGLIQRLKRQGLMKCVQVSTYEWEWVFPKGDKTGIQTTIPFTSHKKEEQERPATSPTTEVDLEAERKAAYEKGKTAGKNFVEQELRNFLVDSATIGGAKSSVVFSRVSLYSLYQMSLLLEDDKEKFSTRPVEFMPKPSESPSDESLAQGAPF